MYYTVIDPNQRWQWKTAGSLAADDLAPRTRAVVNWVDYSDIAFFQTYDRDFSLTSTRTVGQKAFVTRSEGPVALNLRLERETALYGATEVVLERKPILEARLPVHGAPRQRDLRRSADVGRLPPLDPAPGPAFGGVRAVRPLPEGLGPALAVPVAVAQRRGGLPLHPVRGVGRDGRTDSADESYTRTTALAGLELMGPSFARVFDVKMGEVHEAQAHRRAASRLPVPDRPGRPVADAGLRRGRHDPPLPRGPLRPRPAAPRQGEVRRLARDRLPRVLPPPLLRAPGRSPRDHQQRLAARRHPPRQRRALAQLRRPRGLGPQGGSRHLHEPLGEPRLGGALPAFLLLRQPARRGDDPFDAAPVRWGARIIPSSFASTSRRTTTSRRARCSSGGAS